LKFSRGRNSRTPVKRGRGRGVKGREGRGKGGKEDGGEGENGIGEGNKVPRPTICNGEIQYNTIQNL